MENKETISDGKFVAFAYKVKDAADGKVLFEAKESAPDTMIYGVTQDVVPGLAAALKGLSKGDRFAVTLPPEVAFGQHEAEYVQQVPMEAFMKDGKMAVEVKEGGVLDMMTNTGAIVTGLITKVTPEYVEMDFNHPFAGKTVEYEGEVVEVRDATDDELHPRHCGCGGGCHKGDKGDECGDGCGCHNGDNEDDCGCGDNCGCGDGCGCH